MTGSCSPQSSLSPSCCSPVHQPSHSPLHGPCTNGGAKSTSKGVSYNNWKAEDAIEPFQVVPVAYVTWTNRQELHQKDRLSQGRLETWPHLEHLATEQQGGECGYGEPSPACLSPHLLRLEHVAWWIGTAHWYTIFPPTPATLCCCGAVRCCRKQCLASERAMCVMNLLFFLR